MPRVSTHTDLAKKSCEEIKAAFTNFKSLFLTLGSKTNLNISTLKLEKKASKCNIMWSFLSTITPTAPPSVHGKHLSSSEIFTSSYKMLYKD